ncbi:MAG TPA: GGDEF domain-containing protein [Rhodanobacteraceae bacterium]|nr:GGDEF domain-containing protein [Rhodanobacteraceae bacterium]
MRALLLSGAAGFALFAVSSYWHDGQIALPSPALIAVMVALAVIAAASFVRLHPAQLSALGLLCVVVIELGIVLIGTVHAHGLAWVLPGLVLVPIAASPVWLTQRDFVLGTVACLLGPACLCWMLVPGPLVAVQYVVFMLLSLGLSLVIHVFMTRQLQAQLVLEQRLRIIAGTDDLTGIASRGRFFRLAREQVASSRRDYQVLGALYLDVDHFKRLNDEFGHAAGDHALVALAGTLRANLRAGDIIGRIGGEEFAVLLPGMDQGQATATAERLRVATAALPIHGGPITISVGVAALRRDDETPEALLDRADDALRQAKREGRNRVCTARRREPPASAETTGKVVHLPVVK